MLTPRPGAATGPPPGPATAAPVRRRMGPAGRHARSRPPRSGSAPPPHGPALVDLARTPGSLRRPGAAPRPRRPPSAEPGRRRPGSLVTLVIRARPAATPGAAAPTAAPPCPGVPVWALGGQHGGRRRLPREGPGPRPLGTRWHVPLPRSGAGTERSARTAHPFTGRARWNPRRREHRAAPCHPSASPRGRLPLSRRRAREVERTPADDAADQAPAFPGGGGRSTWNTVPSVPRGTRRGPSGPATPRAPAGRERPSGSRAAVVPASRPARLCITGRALPRSAPRVLCDGPGGRGAGAGRRPRRRGARARGSRAPSLPPPRGAVSMSPGARPETLACRRP